MAIHRKIPLLFCILLGSLIILGCAIDDTPSPGPAPTDIPSPVPSPSSIPTAKPLLPSPVSPGIDNPDEPVFISGQIPYTSPFFINSIRQPFVLLEDQAGFVQRDHDFEFPLTGQVMGPVEIDSDGNINYSLSLPAVPQGTPMDVDNNNIQNSGVQIFAVAYWSNTWGDPFLEERDGTGWSTAYASTITDPEKDDEIQGGVLLVWSPDDAQGFPKGFGEDGLLFTEDDPVADIPAGYSFVDLDQEPFNFYKQSHVEIELNEGAGAVNDYSEMDYAQAFQALWDAVSQEYPFTVEKNIDWQALLNKYGQLAEAANNDESFYQVLRDFSYQIPDGHVYVSFNNQAFFDEFGGGLGLVLTELSDGRVLVTDVLESTPGSLAGIKVGDQIISWNGQAVEEAITEVNPFFGPYSTSHTRHIAQVNFLTRVPPDSNVDIILKKNGEAQETEITLNAIVEYDSLFKTIPSLNRDEFYLPVEGQVLDESGLGYLQISTFSADYSLMARLWEHYMENLIDEEIPGLIIDLRVNGGGASRIAENFAGYFFAEEIPLYQRLYFNSIIGKFESRDKPITIDPAPLYYDGPIAVLVSPNCVSACEGFAYSLIQNQRALIVGHYPTAGAFGEVGRGQYELPGDYSMQFPTGRPETLDGKLLIEGAGIMLDIVVPVTEESALGISDTILETAVQALLDLIQ